MVKKSRAILIRNIIILVFLSGGAFSIYVFNSQLIAWISDPANYGRYDVSLYGAEQDVIDPTKLILTELTLNWSDYIDALLNSDLLAGMSELEKLQLLENLFGEDLTDYLDLENLTASEFLMEYGDELEGMLESLTGESFSSDFLDNFDNPALLAVLLAKPMFYIYEQDPSGRPWENYNKALWKMKAYDTYDLTTYDWSERALKSDGNLIWDDTTADQMWFVKYFLTTAPTVVSSIPVYPPSPRLYYESLESDPLLPPNGIATKEQLYLGGAFVETEFSVEQSNQITNLTYQVLFNEDDNTTLDDYTNGLTMPDVSISDPVVLGCLKGPYDGSVTISWDDYRNDNPYFDTVATELESDETFTDATNTYAQMNAIINYIGSHFVYNPYGNARPGSGEDPLEWFCERRESQYPFEFGFLSVSLARLEGISARYVSGYRWSDLLEAQIGGEFLDSAESQTAFPYYLGNIYGYAEAFIPTSTSGGDWVAFDNQFNAEPTVPTPADIAFNLQFDGEWQPPYDGNERFDVFDQPINVEIQLNYTRDGNPMGSQQVTIVDVTYNQTIGSFYTLGTGIGTYTLNLENLVTGTHVLNFSTSYIGVSFGNVSVITVLDDVEIYSNIEDIIISSPPNTPQSTDVFGYVWDPVLNQPVINAVINYTGIKNATPNEASYNFSVSPQIVVSNRQGNYTNAVTVPGFITADSGSDYQIKVGFNGMFDISADIALFNPAYQLLFASYPTIFPTVTPSYIDSTTEMLELINPDYHKYNFTINSVTAINQTVPSYPTGPIYGLRSSLVLDFEAYTYADISWATGVTVNVYDITEGYRLVTSFITDGSGYGNDTFNVYEDDLWNWTVGPHLLSMEAVINGTLAFTHFWVIIQGPVVVNQITESFTQGNGGASDQYLLNLGTGLPYDNFSIAGYMYDGDTSENLSYYIINLHVFDKDWISFTSSYLDQGSFTELVMDPDTGFDQTFNFYDLSIFAHNPFHTDAYFLGEWDMGTNGWNNAWNSYWGAYFISLGTINDTSDSTLSAVTTSSIMFDTFVDYQPTSGINGTTYGTGDSILISSYYHDDDGGIANANITLILLDTMETWSIITDVTGYGNFTITFGPGNVTGMNHFKFQVNYGSGMYYNANSTFFELYYDPNFNFNFIGSLNNQPFTVVNATPAIDRPVDSGDVIQLSGAFSYLGSPISGATVTISDLTNSTTWAGILTDTNGYANKSLSFLSGITTGIHLYRIKVQYNVGIYTVDMSQYIQVDFNPSAFYAFTMWDDIGGRTLGGGETFNVAGTILYKGSPVSGVPERVTNMNNASITNSGDTGAGGYANLSITLGAGIIPGIQPFKLNVSVTNSYGYLIVKQILFNVNFNPGITYYFTPWNNVSGTITSGDSIMISAIFTNNGYGEAFGVAGATIRVVDTTNKSVDFNITTGSNGKANFTILFGAGQFTGWHNFVINVTYTLLPGGYLIQNSSDVISVYFDPAYGYSFVPYNDAGGQIQGANDIVHISGAFYRFAVGFAYGNMTLRDQADPAVYASYLTDGSGYANFTVKFGFGNITGLHTFRLNCTFIDSYGYRITNQTSIPITFNQYKNYVYTDYDDIGYQTVHIINDIIHISCAFTAKGVGVVGAQVSLTDLTNGTVIKSTTTNGLGYANFTVKFDSSMHPGPHKYQLNLNYDADTYTITNSTTLWAVYRNPVTINAVRGTYTSNFTLGQSGSMSFTVTGFLVDSSNPNHGHYDARLFVWIYNSGSTDVSSNFGYSYAVNSYNDNTNGAYSISISITSAPARGWYRVVVGFNGSLSTDPAVAWYTASGIAVNSTDPVRFYVYQNTQLSSDFIIDNSGITGGELIHTIIPMASEVIISGYLNDSTGAPLASKTITIRFYTAGGLVNTVQVTTNAEGYYTYTLTDCPWALTRYEVQFSADTTNYYNAAPITGDNFPQ